MFKSFRTWFDERRLELAHTDPKRARHWHNTADPIQAAFIEAAAVKRARKAVKYSKHCQRHSRANRTHQMAVNDLVFNPFYIAK